MSNIDDTFKNLPTTPLISEDLVGKSYEQINTANQTLAGIKNLFQSLKVTNHNYIPNAGFELGLPTNYQTNGDISLINIDRAKSADSPMPKGNQSMLLERPGGKGVSNCFVTNYFDTPVILPANSTFTISYLATSTGDVGNYDDYISTKEQGDLMVTTAKGPVSQNSFTQYSATYTSGKVPLTVVSMTFGMQSKSAGYAWKQIDNLMIELGSNVTNWVPNSNDYTSQLQDTQTLIKKSSVNPSASGDLVQQGTFDRALSNKEALQWGDDEGNTSVTTVSTNLYNPRMGTATSALKVTNAAYVLGKPVSPMADTIISPITYNVYAYVDATNSNVPYDIGIEAQEGFCDSPLGTFKRTLYLTGNPIPAGTAGFVTGTIVLSGTFVNTIRPTIQPVSTPSSSSSVLVTNISMSPYLSNSVANQSKVTTDGNGNVIVNGFYLANASLPKYPQFSLSLNGNVLTVNTSSITDSSVSYNVSISGSGVKFNNLTNVTLSALQKGFTVEAWNPNQYDTGKGNKITVEIDAMNTYGTTPNVQSVTFPDNPTSIWGASWDLGASGSLQRTGSAVGMQSNIGGGRNDFDSNGPWSKMSRVTDILGNVMVRIPKFYIGKSQNSSSMSWNVSFVKQNDDWYLPSCFYNPDTQDSVPYVDVAAYEGSVFNGQLSSRSNVMPTTRVTSDALRGYANNNNNAGNNLKGYHLFDLSILDMLQTLFTIEFCTINSQKNVAQGNTSGGVIRATGSTDNLGGTTAIHNSFHTFKYRGIENLWGNTMFVIDGVNMRNNAVYVTTDYHTYQFMNYSAPYQPLTYGVPTNDGAAFYTKYLGFDGRYKFANLPSAGGADGSQYFGDKAVPIGTGTAILLGGGSVNTGSAGGLWYYNWSVDNTFAGANVGARLVHKHLP